MDQKPKRQSGRATGDGHWLVIEESTQKGDGLHTHSCGTDILWVYKKVQRGFVKVTQGIPYCPTCETRPPNATDEIPH